MSGDLEQISQAVVEGEEIARRAWETVSGTALGDEIVATVADPIRYRRGRRQVQALVRMQRVIDDAGLAGQVVPDRTLFPLLDFVSQEDDESMVDRWANLLAHAAVGDQSSSMYVAALAGIDALEAGWLEALLAARETSDGSLVAVWADVETAAELDFRLDRLARAGLLSEPGASDREPVIAVYAAPGDATAVPASTLGAGQWDPALVKFPLMLTPFGVALVTRCQPPQPRRSA